MCRFRPRFSNSRVFTNRRVTTDWTGLYRSTPFLPAVVSRKSQKKKKWISDDTYAVIRKKSEAKGKDTNRYQELKAEVQKKLRVDKQQQLEDMCAELEAANTKGNSRQVFERVKSMTRKFQHACNVSRQQLAKI